MRIQRAQTRTVWPYSRSSDLTVPTKELSPRSGLAFSSGCAGGAGLSGLSGLSVWLGTCCHFCAAPSQNHLPSGERR